MTNNRHRDRIKHFTAFGQNLPHAKVYYREDWQIIYFELAGKMFGLMSPTLSDTAIITLKGNPDSNEELHDLYADISAGYHVNKRHWISVKLNTEELSDQEIDAMIKQSYLLVVNNLPVNIRQRITENNL
ncbi:MmcQ/YjbR family DNA-binding protein [Leuconostoc pseudomesenteroides]|uniref:MmcQ/YjbR family DNA-binding protein n=1 Tax=Leuconostoc pseudomesenteroides TaxID=33968 RepID=UPI001120E8A0|nr:MmcQ/YjbR family DNA-binding protein [Leuconostoc pseudomesenteroides]TOZ01905.1 hypothetical protein DIS14_10415 [Leuconostoc pseudomesenteroides]